MTSWFETARFGMFVHWSHCSQQGVELSWPLVGGAFTTSYTHAMPVEQYHASAATFDPRRYDPNEWARMAKRAGMAYAVFTTKHHDGYAMFDTATSEYGVMHSPCGRDLFRAFVDAMRAEGIRIGVYFSLIDWHHPDYPAATDADQPYVFGKWKQPKPEAWARFTDVMFAQIRELLTNYGKIDVIWFDGGWERSSTQWRAKELEAMIRQLQPAIMINDRLPGVGDYVTPEQFVPAQPAPGPWETCLTINETWGYCPADREFKSARAIIHTLCEVAGRGGNLLLNVGPMADGDLQPEFTQRLAVIEGWMARNGESIAGTTPGLEPWQHYGPSTQRDGRVYVHLLSRPYDAISVRGVRTRRVKAVTALSTGATLAFTTRTSLIDQFLNPDPLGELTIAVPEASIDANATVIAIDFADKPLP